MLNLLTNCKVVFKYKISWVPMNIFIQKIFPIGNPVKIHMTTWLLISQNISSWSKGFLCMGWHNGHSRQYSLFLWKARTGHITNIILSKSRTRFPSTLWRVSKLGFPWSRLWAGIWVQGIYVGGEGKTSNRRRGWGRETGKVRQWRKKCSQATSCCGWLVCNRAGETPG